MIKKVFLGFCILLFHTLCFSQIKSPDKRAFNFGIFTGIGGTNYSLIPGLDLHYKGTILRLSPGNRVNSLGFIRELLPLSKTFYNCYWILSIYGSIGKEDDLHASTSLQTQTSDFRKVMILTGLKYYFAKRLYSQLQVGYAFTKYKTPGYPSDKNSSACFEFSLGFNIYKSFVNEDHFE